MIRVIGINFHIRDTSKKAKRKRDSDKGTIRSKKKTKKKQANKYKVN